MKQWGLATDREGVTLVEYSRIPESRLVSPQHSLLSVAMVIVQCLGRNLLVFNSARHCWELPGGHIESAEPPVAAARRELLEESGQTCQELTFEALVRFRFQKELRGMYGAVYSAVLESIGPFTPTPEISRITLWDGHSDIGYINEIDAALLKLAISDRPGRTDQSNVVNPT